MFIKIQALLKNKTGYTLLEMLTVMTIIGILAAVGVPSYKRYQIKAREAVLAEDLYQMRRSIDAFYADYARYPDNIEDLVNGKYMRHIPRDPFTRSSFTWRCIPPEYDSRGTITDGNCFDIVSGSKLIGLNGLPYNKW